MLFVVSMQVLWSLGGFYLVCIGLLILWVEYCLVQHLLCCTIPQIS